jgi:hypothetical protein
MRNEAYQRLTRNQPRSGFAVAVTSRCSLWLGKDHLLLIDSNGYTEAYKRFYFRDIQALTITLTNRRMVWNLILAGLMAIWLLSWGAYLLSGSTLGLAGTISLATVATLLVVPRVLNNLLGPTCTCYLKTAVQTEELPPLKRLRRTKGVFARLRPHITEAQGKIRQTPDSLEGPVGVRFGADAEKAAERPSEAVIEPIPPPGMVS